MSSTWLTGSTTTQPVFAPFPSKSIDEKLEIALWKLSVLEEGESDPGGMANCEKLRLEKSS